MMRLIALLLLWPALAWGQGAFAPYMQGDAARHAPVQDRGGMVVAEEAEAARIGADILRRGGNAVDAAVATGFALAVTFPEAGNLAGGGFMLAHLAATGETVALDYRETAPAAATRDMFLDAAGEPDEAKSLFSLASAGVPGTVDGLLEAHARWGKLKLREVMAPAIMLAERGVRVTPSLAASLAAHRDRLCAAPVACRQFFKPDGSGYRPGERLRQPDLAATLKAIRDKGRAGFYAGKTAAAIAAHMAQGGGLITARDLAGYKSVIRQPVKGVYRGYEIRSMPPPSSGGVHLIQMLNMLEGDDLAKSGLNSAASLHLLTEAMRQAYADRSEYLGDPAFVSVPVERLTDKAYAQAMRAAIPADRARKSDDVRPGLGPLAESRQTTHFSVADAQGNVVSSTYTLNFSFGSGLMVPGTGMLLNNEMDDFAAKPGAPNGFGLLGGAANEIAPGKRPLSSMTPTILFKDGKPVLVLGSPGGARIISSVLQVISNVVDHGRNVAEAVAASRLHHQWRPDLVYVEEGFSPDTLAKLQAMGHRLEPRAWTGVVQAIAIKRDSQGLLFEGAADSREPRSLAAGVICCR